MFQSSYPRHALHVRLGRGAAALAWIACLLPAALPASAQDAVDRGAYLVNGILGCGNCHSPRTPAGELIAGRELSGGLSISAPPYAGTASNITPDRDTGIGTWSDDDIKRAIVEGRRPNHGRLANAPLAAVMAISFFKALLPDDLNDVVAYLRSVKAIRNEVKLPEYRQPVRHDSYPDAEAGFTPAMMADPVRRGAYLVTIGHCMECHSPREKGVSDYSRLGAGGRTFGPELAQGFAPEWKGSRAANISSHATAGIGAWSDEQIKRAITGGVSRDGRALKPPMAFGFYARISEPDLNAIVAYLRTVAAQP